MAHTVNCSWQLLLRDMIKVFISYILYEIFVNVIQDTKQIKHHITIYYY